MGRLKVKEIFQSINFYFFCAPTTTIKWAGPTGSERPHCSRSFEIDSKGEEETMADSISNGSHMNAHYLQTILCFS